MPYKTLTAIICVTIILGLCIWRDIDGAIVGSGIAIIAGLGGWAAHKVKSS